MTTLPSAFLMFCPAGQDAPKVSVYIDRQIDTFLHTYTHTRARAHTHTHTVTLTHSHTYPHTHKHIYKLSTWDMAVVVSWQYLYLCTKKASKLSYDCVRYRYMRVPGIGPWCVPRLDFISAFALRSAFATSLWLRALSSSGGLSCSSEEEPPASTHYSRRSAPTNASVPISGHLRHMLLKGHSMYIYYIYYIYYTCIYTCIYTHIHIYILIYM